MPGVEKTQSGGAEQQMTVEEATNRIAFKYVENNCLSKMKQDLMKAASNQKEE